jgi:hypothetical protein
MKLVPRGARVVGDHDLNTFLLRADPVGEAAVALQVGISVAIHSSKQ